MEFLYGRRPDPLDPLRVAGLCSGWRLSVIDFVVLAGLALVCAFVAYERLWNRL